MDVMLYKICVIFFIVFLFAIYRYRKYLTRNHNYWSERGVDGPKAQIGFGTLFYQLFGNKSTFDRKMIHKYNGLYGLYSGNEPTLVVAKPELIRLILSTDFNCFHNRSISHFNPIRSRNIFLATGEDWKRLRTIASPVFTSTKMNQMYTKVNKCVNQLMNSLQTHEKSENGLDLRVLFESFAIDVTGNCIFNIETNALLNEDRGLRENLEPIMLDKRNAYSIMRTVLPRAMLKRLLVFGTENDWNVRFLLKFSLNFITNRKLNESRDDMDLIDVMIRAQELYERQTFRRPKMTKHITDDEMTAQVFVLLAASNTMIGNALLSAVYELALNEDIQQNLYEELIGYFGTGGDIDFELVAKLPYLDAVISETLRLHNSSYSVPRLAAQDYRLGDTGLVIQKGQKVEIPLYALHRYEKYFPKADSFIPERFLSANKKNIIPYTYIPFGVGPRSCIAMRFALLALKICLSQMVMKYRFNRTSRTDVPILLSQDLLFCSPLRVIVGIEEREL